MNQVDLFYNFTGDTRSNGGGNLLLKLFLKMEIPPKVCNKRSVIPLSSGNNFISSEEFTYFAGGVRRKESLVDTREYVHSYTLYHGEKTEQVALNVNE